MELSGAYLLESLEQKRQVEIWEGISEKEGYLRPFLMEPEGDYSENHIWVISGKNVKDWHQKNPAFGQKYFPQKMLLVISQLDEGVKQILSEEMMRAASLKVTLEIDMHTGNSWYDTK